MHKQMLPNYSSSILSRKLFKVFLIAYVVKLIQKDFLLQQQHFLGIKLLFLLTISFSQDCSSHSHRLTMKHFPNGRISCLHIVQYSTLHRTVYSFILSYFTFLGTTSFFKAVLDNFCSPNSESYSSVTSISSLSDSSDLDLLIITSHFPTVDKSFAETIHVCPFAFTLLHYL